MGIGCSCANEDYLSTNPDVQKEFNTRERKFVCVIAVAKNV
jgi:hypothetical protein